MNRKNMRYACLGVKNSLCALNEVCDIQTVCATYTNALAHTITFGHADALIYCCCCCCCCSLNHEHINATWNLCCFEKFSSNEYLLSMSAVCIFKCKVKCVKIQKTLKWKQRPLSLNIKWMSESIISTVSLNSKWDFFAPRAASFNEILHQFSFTTHKQIVSRNLSTKNSFQFSQWIRSMLRVSQTHCHCVDFVLSVYWRFDISTDCLWHTS